MKLINILVLKYARLKGFSLFPQSFSKKERMHLFQRCLLNESAEVFTILMDDGLLIAAR